MKRALVAAIAAALTTAAVLSASGIGATTTKRSKHHQRHAHRSQSGATGATGAWGAKPSGPPPTMATVLAQMEKRRAAQDQKLADALGVTVTKLRDARDAVEAKRLAAAVKDNRLTQAEADAITACKKAPLTCDRSNLPAFGGRGGHHGPMGRPGGPMGGPGGGSLADLASELGVTTDKLQSALRSVRPADGMRGPDGDGPHDGGMGGPPGGGFGGMQGGGYNGPPPAAGTGA